jgi:hypothetical protein
MRPTDTSLSAGTSAIPLAFIRRKHEMRVLLISANTESLNMPVLPLGMACVAAAGAAAGDGLCGGSRSECRV